MSENRSFVIDRTLVPPETYFDYINTCKKGVSEFYKSLPADLGEKPVPDQALNLVAFYLPQFHRMDVNDQAWGRGFTEWTNVTKASPLFRGHRHPHLPIDMGFYDLDNVGVIERQIELARYAGVNAFCFHYYSFSGRTVMDGPLKKFLALKQRDFKFMLCWANESWTRRWDGGNHEVIIPQVHTPEGDRNFIHEILPYLRHETYLRVDNKLPLILYTPALVKEELNETIAYWRSVARSEHLGELLIMNAPNQDQIFRLQLKARQRPTPFDAMVQFPPIECIGNPFDLPKPFLFTSQFHGKVYDYHDAMTGSLNRLAASPDVIPTVIPSWDNTARKMGRAVIFIHADPVAYQTWLTEAARIVSKRPHNLVFVNAWNEWAESAHLEPCSWYGYAYLEATRNAVQAAASA
jgi:lipopolysaccharide biosynthesis protein